MLDLLKLDSKYEDLTIENTPQLTPQMKKDYVNQATAQVGIGSAVGYPFGVIIVILAVNFLNVIFRFRCRRREKKIHKRHGSRQKYIRIKRDTCHTF